LAKAQQATLDEQKRLARLGRDEFAVIRQRTIDPHTMAAKALRFESSLKDAVTFKDGKVQVGVAVGYAARSSSEEPASDVVSRADQAMYARGSFLRRQSGDRRREG
jgi:predicted signal transduction protein with EAL and GGDEF domain